MIVSFVNVKNLNRFIEYLKSVGVDVEEYTHVVLTDSSEFEIVVCKKGGQDIAYLVVHYIDTHYAALSRLRDDASDREILEALFSVDKKNIWRIPVEPVVFTSRDYEFLRIVNSYRDGVPEEGREHYEHYIKSPRSVLKVIDVDVLISMAYNFKD
ncbi:MAG: hypothetical protein LM582_05005 [Desulfurococcaceae archaeon]|jgi:hypothetical protein|nr:hypothetical protein [Desulfurococcaceae archaeon]